MPLVLAIVAVLIIPAVFITVYVRAGQPRFVSAAEEYRDGSKAPADPGIDGPRIERLFAAIVAASKEGNEPAFSRCFHERRMLAEIERRGGLQAVSTRAEEEELEAEIGATLRDWCDQMKNGLSAWQSLKRCSYKFLEGRGEAEAVVAMRSPDHLYRYRFWLIKEKDEWLIYDYESLEDSFRMSTHNGKYLIRQSKGEISGRQVDRIDGLLAKAHNLMVRNKLDEALETLQAVEPQAQSLLPGVELLQAQVLQRLDRKGEALAKVDLCLQHQKDWVQALQLRGSILHGLRRFTEGTRCQEAVMRLIGEDAEAWYWIGKCREGLGQIPEAKEAYRKGLACDDENADIRRRLKELEGDGK
jgi:tetratricopeptide (TPR) repeat protein